jgi:hypothetical protein
MATFREIINTVLRTVSEDEIDGVVTTLTDSYQKLVATFVNQIKEEVETAHNWRDLLQVHTASITANTSSAVIVGANVSSRVARSHGSDTLVPLVFDVTTPTIPIPLIEMPLAEITYRIAMDIPGTSTEPIFFAIQAPGDGTMKILVYPKPTLARTISVSMFTPQARLGNGDLDVVVRIPQRPIEMGAIWYALEERGEEMGINALFTEERFRKALDDAIARDDAEQGGNDLIPV